eukprot:2381575-Amphidinium_carterae.2
MVLAVLETLRTVYYVHVDHYYHTATHHNKSLLCICGQQLGASCLLVTAGSAVLCYRDESDC